MKRFLKILLVFIFVLGSQVSWADWPFPTDEDHKYARQFLDELRKNKPELFREGEPVSINLVNDKVLWEEGEPVLSAAFEISYEFHYPTGWLIAKITFPIDKSERSVPKYRIYKTTKSVNSYNIDFTGNEEIVKRGNNSFFVKAFEDGTRLYADIRQEVKSNIGVLRVVSKQYSDPIRGYGPPRTLLLDNQEIFRSSVGYIRVYGVYNVGKQPWVLIGENCGGSGCRYDDLSFLRIDNGKQAVKVTDSKNEDFFSERNEVKVTEEKSRLVVDLGHSKQKQKVAILENNKVLIEYRDLECKPLTAKECANIYQIAKDNCMSEYAKEDCSKYAVDILPSGNSNVWLLRYIKNEPGFNQKGFDQQCLSACRSGVLSGFGQFSKAACGSSPR